MLIEGASILFLQLELYFIPKIHSHFLTYQFLCDTDCEATFT